MINPSPNHVLVAVKLQWNVDCLVLKNLRFGRNFRGQIQLFTHWRYIPTPPSNMLKSESNLNSHFHPGRRCCPEQLYSLPRRDLTAGDSFAHTCQGLKVKLPQALWPSKTFLPPSFCQDSLLTERILLVYSLQSTAAGGHFVLLNGSFTDQLILKAFYFVNSQLEHKGLLYKCGFFKSLSMLL